MSVENFCNWNFDQNGNNIFTLKPFLYFTNSYGIRSPCFMVFEKDRAIKRILYTRTAVISIVKKSLEHNLHCNIISLPDIAKILDVKLNLTAFMYVLSNVYDFRIIISNIICFSSVTEFTNFFLLQTLMFHNKPSNNVEIRHTICMYYTSELVLSLT